MTPEISDLRYRVLAYVERLRVRLYEQASHSPTSIGLQNTLQECRWLATIIDARTITCPRTS
jgi:hypothetical protein